MKKTVGNKNYPQIYTEHRTIRNNTMPFPQHNLTLFPTFPYYNKKIKFMPVHALTHILLFT